MSELKYQEVTPISRKEAEEIIQNGPVKDIPFTLVRLAYFDPDWVWVQDKCIGLSSHDDKWVRRICLICFSHIARIHGVIDLTKIDPVLSRMRDDPELRGEVDGIREELDIFLK